MAPYHSLFSSSIFSSINMFFIVFVLLFSKSFAIKCMTNEKSSLLNFISTNKCAFEMTIGETMQDNNQIEGLPNCKTRDADTFGMQGSCYGEVAINYTTKKMSFQFTHVPLRKAFSDPYDDMFGFSPTAESLVQYKIFGNMAENTVVIETRVQCRTEDNCAVDKIRAMLSNLTVVDSRQKIFEELNNFLNKPDTNASDPLT